MKILVCVSKVPDTTTKIVFSQDNKTVDYTGVQFIINPYDEHGLSKALELKEKLGGIVTVITVDDASAEAVIRKCLAIGADDAIRVNTLPRDPLFVAEQIAAAVKDKGFDLIITGRESIDYNSSVIGDMIGEFLGIPSLSLVRAIDFNGQKAEVTRFIDGGYEKTGCDIPVVISATKELAEPRIPNMRGIMAARTKPITVVEAENTRVQTEIISYEPPKPKSAVKLIDPSEAEKLIDLLHNESKVI
jgi:electron transfer flavoprotein beta subunit